MKIARRIAIGIVIYIGLVVVFESLIGVFQPAGQSTLVITTGEPGGATNNRVLARLESGGQLYVAANHWPRAWYNQALENPNVQVTLDGIAGAYTAVPITGDERDRVESENRAGIGFRLLTGFPPRHFLRLDPR